MLLRKGREALHQFRAAGLEVAIDRAIMGFEDIQGCQRRRHALDVAVVGTPVHHALVEQRVHDVASARDHRQRETGRHRLCIDAEIGGDPELSLRPAQADAEPGDDLVADEESTVLVA